MTQADMTTENTEELMAEAEKKAGAEAKKIWNSMKGCSKRNLVNELSRLQRIHGISEKDTISDIKHAVVDAHGVWGRVTQLRRLQERKLAGLCRTIPEDEIDDEGNTLEPVV